MEYQIREIRQEEYAILDEFLYEAIFIPDGVEHLPSRLSDSRSCRFMFLTLGRKMTTALLRRWMEKSLVLSGRGL